MFTYNGDKKEKVKKKAQLVENVKKPTEAGMVCTIDDDILFLFMENTWIRYSGALSHTMNDDIGLFNVIDINESIQGSSRNMLATKM